MSISGTGIGVLLAGLRAAETRATIRAQNIANASTPNYQPLTPEQTNAAGGPLVKAVQKTQSPTSLATPQAGFDALNVHVNLAVELTDLLQATRAFEANASALKTAFEVEDALLEATRSRD